jgi:hypothetical protein
MSVRSTRVVEASGRIIVEERDGDTNELLRRFEAASQPEKVRREDEMRERYRDWKRWQDTRLEAEARTAPAAVITALTNRENQSWTQYVDAINEWRLL